MSGFILPGASSPQAPSLRRRVKAAILGLMVVGASALSVAGVGAPIASAAPICPSQEWNGFAGATGLQINGDAAIVGNALRVSPAILSRAGSAFTTTPVQLINDGSFSTHFQFTFTSPVNGGADGLVFVVQPLANNVGGLGGGIGYQGITPSIGVEFDNWFNAGTDPAGFPESHVGIDINGSVVSNPVQQLTYNLDNGGMQYAWVDYSGASDTLEVRLATTNVRPALPLLSRPGLNLPSLLGTTSVFAGFTSATGAAAANHDVHFWHLDNCYIIDEPPLVDAGGPYNGTEGSPIALDGTVTDDGVSPVAYQWTYNAALAEPGTTCTFSAPNAVDTNITCTDNGPVTVTLSADDAESAPVTDTATVTIANAPPEITSITVPLAPVAVGTLINASATFTDAGANDTHTWSIDWDDGSADSVGAAPVSANHVYTAAGIYTIEVTVNDDDGGSDTELATAYIVVYDPSAGFVTGGGWFDSPAGAYAADLEATGKAHFGFVSKYQKGATVPTGNTQFQFQAGNLNFHSTSYDWLVIAGARAQYKGVGTINGAGEYGFFVSAIDGNVAGGGGVDRVRIKIWNLADNSLVYDNQLGGADDVAPTTALGAGSIVIHSK